MNTKHFIFEYKDYINVSDVPTFCYFYCNAKSVDHAKVMLKNFMELKHDYKIDTKLLNCVLSRTITEHLIGFIYKSSIYNIVAKADSFLLGTDDVLLIKHNTNIDNLVHLLKNCAIEFKEKNNIKLMSSYTTQLCDYLWDLLKRDRKYHNSYIKIK